MPNYVPSTDPATLDYFQRYTRRNLTVGAINTVIFIAYILFAPPALMSHLIAFIAVLAIMIAVLIIGLAPFRMKREYKELGFGYFDRPVLPHPVSIRFQLSGVAIFGPFMGMMFAHSEPIFSALLILFTAPLIYAGGIILHYGTHGREPAPPSCSKCAYPIDPQTLPCMCPECAAFAASIDALTRAPIIRRPNYIWAGLAMMAFGIAVGSVTISKPAALLSNLPRPARLAIAASNSSVFERIDTAKLSPTERDNLIDAIIDARDGGDDPYQHDQLNWISTELLAGRLTPNQIERFTRGNLNPSFITRPSTSPFGEPMLEVSCRTDTPGLGIGVAKIAYFSDGIRVDNLNPEPPSAQMFNINGIRRSFKRRGEVASKYPSLAQRDFVPSITLPKHAAEDRTIECRLVFVVFDPTTKPYPAITWHSDGTYSIAPVPLAAHEFTATKIIPASAP